MNRNLGKRVYLYGLDANYQIVDHFAVPRNYPGFQDMKLHAHRMKLFCPQAQYIFAANNNYEVYSACIDSVRSKTMEDRVIFKIILESEGIRMY